MDLRISIHRTFAVILVLCTAILAGRPDAYAQRVATPDRPGNRQGEGQTTTPNLLGLQDLTRRPATPQDASMALDVPVDPETYVLGPGDELSISFRGGIGAVFTATVTPEGNLLVRQFPMLHVGGLTLAAARDTITSQWSEGLNDVPVEVALSGMRRMRVSVGGAVEQPGQYVVTPADRALTLVDLAGGFTETASKRRAVLVNPDGSRLRVDALRYLRSGEMDANPRLKSGSHLIVEPEQELDEQALVQVDGGVKIPGMIEWLPGDRLRHVVQVAGGLLDSNPPDSIFVTRFQDGQPETVGLSASSLEDSDGPEVHPGDLVYARVDRQLNPPRATVEVKGEVRHPGVYPVVAGQTRLLQVLERTGGLTDRASLRGSRIWRKKSDTDFRAKEVERIDSTIVDVLSRVDRLFVRDYQRSMQRDFFPVDFRKLLEGSQTERDANNIVLQDSLVVNIPRQVSHVIVMGAVPSPGYYEHNSDWDYKDYIDAAGDYLKEADKDQVRQMPYESGLVVLARNDMPIYPGDVIYVPERNVPDFWTQFRTYFGVFLQAATLALLIATST